MSVDDELEQPEERDPEGEHELAMPVAKSAAKPAEKPEAAEAHKPPAKNYTKEGIYDKIPLTKKQLDVIIVVLIVAIVVFLVLGILKGNGYIR